MDGRNDGQTDGRTTDGPRTQGDLKSPPNYFLCFMNMWVYISNEFKIYVIFVKIYTVERNHTLTCV